MDRRGRAGLRRGVASTACATTSPATRRTRRRGSSPTSCGSCRPRATCAPSSTTLHGAAFDAVRRDVAQQLGRLVFPGFITATGARRLADVERYLRGAAWRLERLTKNAAVDRDRMRAIHELEDLYRQPAARSCRAGGRSDGELGEVPWLLEELRISQFAQAIGPQGPGRPHARSAGSSTRLDSPTCGETASHLPRARPGGAETVAPVSAHHGHDFDLLGHRLTAISLRGPG